MTTPRTPSHDDLRRDLGAYVLGALEPGERDRLERHLADCAACRNELARLAVLPGLLAPLREEAPQDGDALPPVTPVLRRIQRERRRTRWTLRATAAAAVVAVALLIGQVVQQPPPGTTFAAGTGDATAVVRARPWGSHVALEAALRDADGFVLLAVAEDGHRTQVASWSAVESAITLQGSCYLAPEQIRLLEVRTPDDDIVAVLHPQ